VFNKIDALPPEQQPRTAVDTFQVEGAQVPRVFVSSRTGEGLGSLRSELARIVHAATPPPAEAATPGSS
jgi:GTPase